MSVDILRIRKALGRDAWLSPKPFGPGGWHITSRSLAWTVTVTTVTRDGVDYVAASMAGFDELPSYSQLTQLHEAVFGEGQAYVVWPPPPPLPNQPVHAMHLQGRADGVAAMPLIGGPSLQLAEPKGR